MEEGRRLPQTCRKAGIARRADMAGFRRGVFDAKEKLADTDEISQRAPGVIPLKGRFV